MQEANLAPKALLLINNAPSHPPIEEQRSDDGQIIAMYMPPNVTALIQPMDQNIIRLTKLHYKKSLLSMIIANPHLSVQEQLKSLNLRDAAIYLAGAWENVTVVTITKCWKRILDFGVTNLCDFDSDDDLPLSTYVQRTSDPQTNLVVQIQNLIKKLNPNVTCEYSEVLNLSVEINNDVESQNDTNSDSSSVCDETLLQRPRINSKKAIQCLNIVLQWADETDADCTDILTLRKMRDRAVLSNVVSSKQQQITKYFNKN